MKKLKSIIASLVLVIAMMAGSLSLAATTVHADAKSDVCTAIDAGAGCTGTNGGPDIAHVLKVVVNILSWVVGIVAVIMIVIAGLKYITSGGDSNGVASAKNTIIYSVVGLVIAALAQFIVQFVLNRTK